LDVDRDGHADVNEVLLLLTATTRAVEVANGWVTDGDAMGLEHRGDPGVPGCERNGMLELSGLVAVEADDLDDDGKLDDQGRQRQRNSDRPAIRSRPGAYIDEYGNKREVTINLT
jgi:hypothetical protein